MSKFCTGCGSQLLPGASFCTSCGKKVEIAGTSPDYSSSVNQGYTYNQSVIKHSRNKKVRIRKPLWLRLALYLLVAAVIVAPVGYGVWKAGEVTGFWNKRALDRASANWEKQPGLKSEEKDIFSILNSFKDLLSVGDIETAMAYVHPMSKDEIYMQINSNPDKLPVFVNALDSLELIFLSDDPGYYDALRVAEVMAGIPSKDEPVTGISYIYLIKTEDGWVVEKIS